MIVRLIQSTCAPKPPAAVRALKGVSIDLRAGGMHALPGENGAGKFTLVKAITGAHRSDGAAIEIHGRRVAHLNPAAGSLPPAAKVRTILAKPSRS